jgi:glycosyltransferase involved in cell wall biosynthesis
MNALIIPVYKNEESINDLLDAVTSIGNHFPGEFTATFIVDGSPDRSYSLLEKLLPAMNFKTQLVLHSRNFGSFAAIKTGLQRTDAAHYAVMAADLQEPPELLIEIFKTLSSKESDVVIGSRNSRKDPFFSKLFSTIFWDFYRKNIIHGIPKGGVDIFGCNRRVRDFVLELHESNSSLIGQLFWVGFNRAFVSYDRRERAKGKSSWTVGKKINYLMDSIFAFTDLPIKILLGTGFFGAMVSLIFALSVVTIKLLGQVPVSGYAATILTIVFFGTVNIFGLGIIGSYAHRTFENTKGRPYSIIVDEKTFEGKKS